MRVFELEEGKEVEVEGLVVLGRLGAEKNSR